MAAGPALVEFAPVALGPFLLSRVTVSGALHAVALLASIGLSVGLARRRGLLPRLVVETHVLAVPVALLLSRARGLAAAFPAFLHDTRLLGQTFLASPDLVPAALGAALLVGLMAWASGRPSDLADSVAAGSVLVASAMLSDIERIANALGFALILIGGAGAVLSWRLARAGRRPGEAALVACETVVISAAVGNIGEDGRPSLLLVGHAILLGMLLTAHVILRSRAPLFAGGGARG